MTDEVRQRCLEPFFSTKGQQGTGLGLALVQATVARHHGTLALESELGQGTTFIMTLPRPRQARRARSPSASGSSARAGCGSSSWKTIPWCGRR